MKKKLSVLIIGCGNIGGRFDEGGNHLGHTFSHAGAYSLNNNYSIDGCIDTDPNALKRFAKAWNISKAYSSIEELLKNNHRYDVISICTPTNNHKDSVLSAILLKPKLIFCEKPLGSNLNEVVKIVEACQKKNILLAVNYTRRWSDDILDLKKSIDNKEYGSLRSISGIYTKGLVNNGSHLLDLILFLFGDLDFVARGNLVYDYFDTDPSIPLLLSTIDSSPVQISIGNNNDYSHFEITFVFSKMIISMLDGGLRWCIRKPAKSSYFDNYITLGSEIIRKGSYPDAMKNAMQNIYEAVVGDETLHSTGQDSVNVFKLLEEIRNY